MNNNQSAQYEIDSDAELTAVDKITVIKLPKLLEIIPKSRSWVYLKINKNSHHFDPHFPQPIRLGSNSIGWLLGDVQKYVQSLKKQQVI
jgi:prophage regulatory protein